MNRRLAGALALGTALALSSPAASAAGAPGQVPSPRLVAELPSGDYGSFAESLAVWGGSVYASLTTWSPDEVTPNTGQVWKIGPNGRLQAFGPSLTVCLITGLAFDTAGQLYAGTYSCELPSAVPSGVLRINADGTYAQVLHMPANTFPNGVAFHRGDLYVSDAFGGGIWKVRPGDPDPGSPWFSSSLLAPARKVGLGANGLAFWGDTLYAVNYATGSVIAIPVRADGSAGTPTVVVTDRSLVTADGIAFDVLGRLWITVNDGSLVRLDRDGRITVISSGPAWLDYPTQPAFGTTATTRTTLYVSNGSMNNGTPNVIAFDVDVAGQRLP